jgi:cobalt-precorrin-5B (C1)-methyltransferase
LTAGKASCAIRKDSGDDPDDTNGILVYATVEKTASGIELLAGGKGVGRVTKPGLACAVGGPAINPTPRRMITEEVRNDEERHALCRRSEDYHLYSPRVRRLLKRLSIPA